MTGFRRNATCPACGRRIVAGDDVVRDEEGYRIHETCGVWASTSTPLDNGRSANIRRVKDGGLEMVIDYGGRGFRGFVVPAAALRKIGFGVVRRGK